MLQKDMQKYAPRYESLLTRWWGRLNEFLRWYPNDKEAGDDLHHWMWEQYKDDDRYVPAVWDPTNPKEDPRYAEEAE